MSPRRRIPLRACFLPGAEDVEAARERVARSLELVGAHALDVHEGASLEDVDPLSWEEEEDDDGRA